MCSLIYQGGGGRERRQGSTGSTHHSRTESRHNVALPQGYPSTLRSFFLFVVMFVCVFEWRHSFEKNIYIYIHIYTYVYMCVCVCVYIYIYIYTYTHTYTYTHVYDILRCLCVFEWRHRSAGLLRDCCGTTAVLMRYFAVLCGTTYCFVLLRYCCGTVAVLLRYCCGTLRYYVLLWTVAVLDAIHVLLWYYCGTMRSYWAIRPPSFGFLSDRRHG